MADKDESLLLQLSGLASHCYEQIERLTNKFNGGANLSDDEIQFLCLHSAVHKRLNFIIENFPYLKMTCEEYNKAISQSNGA